VLYTPACKVGKEKRALAREDIKKTLEVVGLRERLMSRMALFDGTRPGEVLAIRLGKIADDSSLIDRRVHRGTMDAPKCRKGKRTSRVVALSPGTREDLQEWRKQFEGRSPDAFLFPSEAAVTTVNRDNIGDETSNRS
jgi:integrase